MNEDSRKREIVIFVRANSHFKGKVPLGRYRIIGVHGTTWYGEKDYFGDQSTFFKVRLKTGGEVITFYKDKTTVHGKSLNLNTVVDGNMTSPQSDVPNSKIIEESD